MAESINVALILEARNKATEVINRVNEKLGELRDLGTSAGDEVAKSFDNLDAALKRAAGISQDDVAQFERVAEAAGLSSDEIDKYKQSLHMTAINAQLDAEAASIERVGQAAGMSASEIEQLKLKNQELRTASMEAATAADEQATATEEAGAKSEESSGLIGGMSGKFLTVAGAVGYLGYKSIKSAMEFQESMDSVQGHANMSNKVIASLQQAILSTAGTTTFSAQEIASAYAPVAGEFDKLNGQTLTTAQSMNVLKASQQLAEASGSNLTSTTKTLADTMSAFHVKADDAATASNSLWNISRLLGMSTDQVGRALNQLEPRIVGSGMNLQQLGGFMLEVSSVAGKGRQAIRLASQGISQLITPSSTASKALGQLGINLDNSQGKFIGMKPALAAIHAALAKLPGPAAAFAAAQKENAVATELATLKLEPQTKALKAQETVLSNQKAAYAQQASSLSKTSLMYSLFGRSANVMTKIVEGGVPAFEQASQAVKDHGQVEQSAERQAHSMAGQMKKLKATASDLFLELGTNLIPIVTHLAGIVTAVVAPIAQWISHNQKLVTIVLAVVAGIGTLIGIVLAASKAIEIIKVAMIAFSEEGNLAFMTNPWILAIMALVLVGIYLATHWKKIWHDIKQWADDAWHFIDGDVFQPIMGVVHGVINFIKTHWKDLLVILTGPFAPVIAIIMAFHNQIEAIFSAIWNGIRAVWNDVANAGLNAWHAIVNVFEGAGSWLYNAGRDIISGLWNGIRGAVGGVISKVKHIGSSIIGAVKGIFKIFSPSHVFSDIGVQLMAGLGQGVESGAQTSAMPAVASTMSQVVTSAQQLPKMSMSSGTAGGQGITIQVNMQGSVYGSLEKLAQDLGKQLTRTILPQAGVFGAVRPS